MYGTQLTVVLLRDQKAEIFIHHFTPVNGWSVCALDISSNSLALANHPVLFNYPLGQKRLLCIKMQDSVYGRNCVQAIWRRYAASATSGHTPAILQCFHWDLSLDFSLQESHHVMYYKLFEMALFASKEWWILIRIPLWLLESSSQTASFPDLLFFIWASALSPRASWAWFFGFIHLSIYLPSHLFWLRRIRVV